MIQSFKLSSQINTHEQNLIKKICSDWDWISYKELEELLKQDSFQLWYYSSQSSNLNSETQELSALLLAQFSPEGADLIYIYTQQNHRRKGLAIKLLNHLASVILNNKSCLDKKLFLEVADSNNKARSLYESWGMELVGERKKYYKNGDTALVFSKEFS